MNTITTIDVPSYHTKVSGDTEKLTKSLEKKQLNRAIKSAPAYFEVIDVRDLEPLESQRNAKTTWIEKALKLSGGFDSVAAGIIQVARDPETGKNYVWDGCGRLALAIASGVPTLNCWVTEMSKQNAAHYFVYTQKTSNRGLQPGELFINAFEFGDPKAVAFADTLKRLGLRIQGADDYWVPKVPLAVRAQYPTCKERSVKRALFYAAGDETIVRFARDTIVQAGWNDDQVREDLLPGLVIVYMCYPEMMKNGLSKSLRSYFQSLAGTVTQKKLSFKDQGGNMHNRESESVAIGIIKCFRDSPAFKAGYKATVTEKRIKQYVYQLMNKPFAEEEDED